MKAILFDIDQTIQNKENDTPIGVWKRLKRFKRRGIKIACITARPYPMCKAILDKAASNAYSIIDNGACLIRNDGAKRTNEIFIDKRPIKNLFDRLVRIPYLRIGFSARKGFYANEKYLKEITNWFGENKNFHLLTSLPNHIYSIWIRGATQVEIDHAKRSIPGSCNLSLEGNESVRNSFFIYNENVSRSEALRTFCSLNNVLPKDIAFIGDGLCDVEIAKRVGISAAVGNAHQKLKEISDFKLTESYGGGFFEFLEILEQ